MSQQKNSKTRNILLWVAQIILAGSLLWGGAVKLFQPIEKLSAMWPWTAQVPVALLKFTGLVDLAGALGLILPMLLHTKEKVTSLTAMCIMFLMIAASIFHISRGEASVIGANMVFLLIAAFIAWGRLNTPKTSE